MSDKGTKSAKKRVSPLKSQTGMPRAEIIGHLRDTFAALHGGTPADITPEELGRAEELVASKFSTPEWLNRVP